MTKIEFKTETRLARGKLSKLDGELDTIYNDGIVELRELCYKNKQMGITNIAELTKLDAKDQKNWFVWLSAKGFKATKNEMELKIDSYTK